MKIPNICKKIVYFVRKRLFDMFVEVVQHAIVGLSFCLELSDKRFYYEDQFN